MAVVYYKPMEVQQANEKEGADGIMVPQDYVAAEDVPEIVEAFEAAVAEAAEGGSGSDAESSSDSDGE